MMPSRPKYREEYDSGRCCCLNLVPPLIPSAVTFYHHWKKYQNVFPKITQTYPSYPKLILNYIPYNINVSLPFLYFFPLFCNYQVCQSCPINTLAGLLLQMIYIILQTWRKEMPKIFLMRSCQERICPFVNVL